MTKLREIMKWVKWGICDLRNLFWCLLRYRQISALKEDLDYVYVRERGEVHKYSYSGMNWYGFADGMIPQYSVIIQGDGYVNYPDTSNRASCFLHRSIDHPNGCNVLRNVHRRRLGLFHPYIFMI